MRIALLGSTKPGHSITQKEALLFSGHSAGICYLPDTIDVLFGENVEKTTKRANGNLASGHHSVFGHVFYNLLIEECPKIIAMILNNEKIYNTSEKSARYTKMRISGKEKELYDKWLTIYQKRISEVYPDFPEKKVEKLAQENARYLISVFTPATTMEYTVSLQQLNYIVHWMEDYIDRPHSDRFEKKVASCLREFIGALPANLVVPQLCDFKGRGLSLFATRDRREEFGENYSINYRGSFAQLAQAQRHRTLAYEMSLPDDQAFYVPPIIRATGLMEEWRKDIASLDFPQGMLVNINERGTYENFILKCGERLCGAAQLEIAQQCFATAQRYYDNAYAGGVSCAIVGSLHDILAGRTRCRFLDDFKCTSPCAFCGSRLLDRKI